MKKINTSQHNTMRVVTILKKYVNLYVEKNRKLFDFSIQHIIQFSKMAYQKTYKYEI